MEKCRSCGGNDLYMFLDLGHMPPSNSFLNRRQLGDPETIYPLKVYFCPSCALVQIDEIVSAGKIFDDAYPYFSSDTTSNVVHAKEFADATFEHGIKSGDKILEIGSNDGYMLAHFQEMGCDVLGIDPARQPVMKAMGRGLNTICGFFGPDFAKDIRIAYGQYNLVCGINVFAHQPDLNGFVSGMKSMLLHDGMIVMEFPHLLRLLEDCQFDTIYHEHYNYFSAIALVPLFARHGMEIFDIEETPTHGGSIRIYVQNNGVRPVNEAVLRILREETEMLMGTPAAYGAFAHRVHNVTSDLLEFIHSGTYDQKVVSYGAAAKGNTLLNYCGIKPPFVQYAIDRSPHKRGLFLPGSHIAVVGEEVLKRFQPDYVLITAWNLADEIMEQLKYIRIWDGHFVIPIPELKVI